MNEDDLNLEGTDDLDDLEAQLAELGFGGDGDDDGGIGGMDLDSLLGGGGDDDDPFAAFEALGEGGSASAPPSGGGAAGLDDLDDLDRQLEMLLNADKSADETFDALDISGASPVQTIYDPEVDGGIVTYVKGGSNYNEEETPKKKLFENVRLGHIIAVAVIGLMFIIVGGTTAVLATRAVQAQHNAIEALAHFEPIVMPTEVANNANAIFVNQVTYLRNQRFTLSRLSIGYSGTFFFIDEYFNVDDYYIVLYDQYRNLYVRTDFDISATRSGGVALKFATIPPNVMFLTLRIQCNSTNEYTSFYFRFEEPPVVSAPIFITQPQSVMDGTDADTAGFIIRHAVFDNASSRIHYSFTYDPNVSGIRKRADASGPFILLQDGVTAMTVLTNNDANVYFGDISEFDLTMGSATFGPVFSLNNMINVQFTDLVYVHPNPVIDILPQNLFGRDQNIPHVIQAGNFNLNLEAMAQQGNMVVMTLHGTDANNRRVETIPNTSLHINSGTEIFVVPGVVHSRTAGSDVVFDLTPYLRYIRQVGISNYTLVVDSVEFAVPQLNVPIQLSQLYNMPSMRRYAAENSISEAFYSMLAYMSNEISSSAFVGWCPETLEGSNLLNYFAPRQGLTERAMYGVSVVTGDLMDNYNFVAVVQIQWASGIGDGKQYLRETFRVVAHSRDSIWTIVDYELI